MAFFVCVLRRSSVIIKLLIHEQSNTCVYEVYEANVKHCDGKINVSQHNRASRLHDIAERAS